MSNQQIRVGAVLYGFCGGCFGRDSYSDKRVEAIGADWLVARETDRGGVVFFSGNPAELEEYLDPRSDPHYDGD